MGSHAGPRRDSAFAVIVRRSRVLLVRPHGKARWQLPGGGLKRRESHSDAACREVEEETGLVPHILGLTGRYSRTDGSAVVVFAARVAESAELGGPRNEIREQRWVRHGKALQLLAPKARRRLVEALAAAQSFSTGGLVQQVG
jgi:8-oxo-dGTP pyrophosphatase MutT (NUDIX family)